MPRRTRPVLVIGVAAVLAAVAATAEATPVRHGVKRISCAGVTSVRSLWASPRRRASLTTQRTTIRSLVSQERPRSIKRHGRTPFELRTYEVVGQITLVRKRPNTTIQLVLYDGGAYVNALMPPLQCLSTRIPGRAKIAAARASYIRQCGMPGPDWEESGAVAYVAGIGFWGPTSGRGIPPNGATLAPVTAFELIAGCGTGFP
jgi:hypothetical protein